MNLPHRQPTAYWPLVARDSNATAELIAVLAELQGLLVASHLDDLYTLQPPTP